MKTTKLLRMLMLTLALVACMCMLFVSCGDDETPESTQSTECQHKGGTATCKAKAVCTECNKEYGELAAHDYADATCAAPKTCTICQATEGEALAHSWKDANCESPKTCTVCQATEGEPIGTTGQHDWLFTGYDEERFPTCTEEGIAYYECIVCAETKQETGLHRFLWFIEHDSERAPTCTEYGYSIFECDWCSERETRKVAPQHAYEETNVVYASCTEDGVTSYECTACGDAYDEVVEATGHWLWSPDSTTATCTEAGVETYTCFTCGSTVEEEVEAYGHDWYVDDTTLDLNAHTVSATCSTCETTETISSLGMVQDPIVITCPGTFTSNAGESWVYYTFEHTEGYITFTFDTSNINVMVMELNEVYATQYFWGGEQTWTAELMQDGSYVIAISTNDGEELDIEVTTTIEETDVPDLGEVPEKPIEIMSVNTGYVSAGKVWYVFTTPTPGNVVITLEGEGTVSYGLDPESLTVYSESFTDNNGYTTYYILVESENDVTLVVNVEVPLGSMNNPLQIVDGNNTVATEGTGIYYVAYEAVANGTLTLTFDSTTYANVVIMYGANPYMMYTPLNSGDEIEVQQWTTYYFGVTTSDNAPVEFTISSSFEAAPVEPSESDGEIGEKIGTMDVETTDTYGYNDMYTYTAENAGKYTFYVPAGVGFYSKAEYDTWGDAEIDFNNAIGGYISVELEAGEEYSFYVGSYSKGTWTLDIYYYVAE